MCDISAISNHSRWKASIKVGMNRPLSSLTFREVQGQLSLLPDIGQDAVFLVLRLLGENTEAQYFLELAA